MFRNLFSNRRDRKRMITIITLCVSILFCAVLGVSFSAFTESVNKRAVNITVGTLNYSTTINGIAGDIITAPAGETVFSNIVLLSENSINTKYELIYTVCSDSTCASSITKPAKLNVEYSTTTDNVSGIITSNGSKTIKIVVTNYTNATQYIKINVNAGFTHNSLKDIDEIASYHNITEEYEEITLLAILQDGEPVNTFPNNSGFNVEITCLNPDGTPSSATTSSRWDSTNNKWLVSITDAPGKTTCNVNFNKKFDFADLIGTSGNGSLYQDAYGNLRYDGLNPNNYAYFNCDDNENPTEATCEKWRIIGVFDVKPNESGTAEKRIKLIREDLIGSAVYHADSNVWSTSLIAAGLANSANGNAYGDNGNGTNIAFYLKAAAKSLISPAVWYVRASNNNITASQAYTNEQSATWIGSMGLMSASDYGFASSSCKDGSETLNYYNNSSCRFSNWLKKGINEWIMISYYYSTNHDLYVTGNASILDSDVTFANGIRPTVYLNSDVQVRGTGTSGDRYTFK